ncbi:MAG: hypothetical protein AMK72_08810 [Planctomycetes bacterium SM23_25]|nr:MAG: hypothetical protein AMK72_08810 [Planctomycetes bacterium SM23_25]
MEIVHYKGWHRNLRLANKHVELIATLDVGPRVIRLAVPGGKNVFKNYPDMMGKTGEPAWQIRGGHRLWFAPEHPVKTYFPDNRPVAMKALPGRRGVRLVSEPETPNGIQKEIDITLHGRAPHVRLVHRIRNVGRRAVELAPWALTVMARGGTAVIGLPERGSHPRDLLPNQHVVLWPYTDLGDSRLTLGTRTILLRQTAKTTPQKLGLANPEGWAAYAVHRCLFVKRFAYDPRAAYPDTGCNTELFTNADMLEVESLGPLARLAPGRKVEHLEDWYLFSGVPPIATEADADNHVRPLLRKAR